MKGDVKALGDALLESIPDHLRGLIPSELGPTDLVKWYLRNKNLLVRQRVVSTDTRKPSSTPAANDLRNLPRAERIAKAREMSGRY